MSALITETEHGVTIGVLGYGLSDNVQVIATRTEGYAVVFDILDYQSGGGDTEVHVDASEAAHLRLLLNADHAGTLTLDRGEGVDGERFALLNLCDAIGSLAENAMCAVTYEAPPVEHAEEGNDEDGD